MSSTKRKLRFQWVTPALIGGVLGFLLGQFPNYFELYQKWFAEPLSLSVASFWSGTNFYRVYTKPDGIQDAIPAGFNVYVYLNNNGDKPVSIRSYSLSARTNQWERLIPLRYPADEKGTIITMRPNDIMRVDLTAEGFDYKAQRGAIPAHGTLSGWLLFESHPSAKTQKLRFEFVDSENHAHTIDYVPEKRKEGFASLESALIPLGPAEPIPDFMQKYRHQ
jgi:hypothetical protein